MMRSVFAVAALVTFGTVQVHSAPAIETHDHSGPAPLIPSFDKPAAAPETDHSHMDHSAHNMGAMEQTTSMTGALGNYAMAREASGTAWQSDASRHGGVHTTSGDWMLMGHAQLNAVYDWQEGPRGNEKTFVSGMVMGMARRDFENGNALQFRAMLSPDPFMGKPGLPLLLASGETADGVTPLIDRQHPHELVMELSGSYSFRVGEKNAFFIYAGLPGEPAFGPPAFMHRQSISDSPEPPISHHWLDSTHITFGVVTAGYVHDSWKIEASRFHGREPDESRYDIETGPLDSTAVRLSWNPSQYWSLQGSWAHVKSPELLEPADNQTKWSVSAIYARPVGDIGWWSTTAAWGRRSAAHEPLDAIILESAINLKDRWTLFGRAERTENNELVPAAGHHGSTYTVSKASVGLIRDFKVAGGITLGFGGLYGFNFLPTGLKAAYGGNPGGAMVFARLKIE